MRLRPRRLSIPIESRRDKIAIAKSRNVNFLQVVDYQWCLFSAFSALPGELMRAMRLLRAFEGRFFKIFQGYFPVGKE
jgi:hypothetical protein